MVYHKNKAAEITQRIGDVLGVHNVKDAMGLLYYTLAVLLIVLGFFGIHMAELLHK